MREIYSFNWTVDITFARTQNRQMTSRDHDVQYIGHMYAISYAQT